MNSSDFINVNGLKWGVYPYYDGAIYSEQSVLFGTFGAKTGIQYGSFENGWTASAEDIKADLLSIYNNGGLKEYYGDNIFQKNDALVSNDDFIRRKNNRCAIPTEEELKQLINVSDITCSISNNKAILQIVPHEFRDGERVPVGQITIPMIGYLSYVADRHNNPTQYTFKSDGKKTFGPNNEYVYTDVYLMTSTISKKESERPGETYARVLHILIKASWEDDESTPEEDIEFITFEVNGEPKFEDMICNEGDTSTYKDHGFMVLPIRYDNDVNVKLSGNLLVNEHTLAGYNQEYDKYTNPCFTIEPFGIPEIINGYYDFTFNRKLSDGNSIISTEMIIKEGVADTLRLFKEYEYIGDNKIKVKSVNSNDNSYWIVSNNDCLYIEETSGDKILIFDDRSLFGDKNNTTTLEIIVNISYTEKHEIPEDNFVLPSIYKPFYTKKIYTIEPYYDENDKTYTYFLGSNTSVYNGIGLFACKGIQETEDSVSPYIDISDEIINNIEDEEEELPSDLRVKLYKYFDNNPSFADEFEYFYNFVKHNDLYAIGVFDDKLEIIDKSTGKMVVGVENPFAPLPIFRSKPLILSTYNESVFDYVDFIPVMTDNTFNGLSTVRIDNKFITVKEPNTKFFFNKEEQYQAVLDFGDLFDKINLPLCNATTPENGFSSCVTDFENVESIIKEGRKRGIRYYIVNDAFYTNYMFANTYNTSKTSFLTYTDEYYKNREYYDLNPHKPDFKYSETWNNHAQEDGYVFTGATMVFYIDPQDTGLILTQNKMTLLTALIERQDTWSAYVDKECSKLYNLKTYLYSKDDIDPYNLYKVSFWIQNTDVCTLRLRVKLGNKMGVLGFTTEAEENSGKASYEFFIINPNEKRHIVVQGYAFKDSDIEIWIRPEYKNQETNLYYRSSFRITRAIIETVSSYVPFFDMIPALKNTKGYVYSAKDSNGNDGLPNYNAPIAMELYLDGTLLRFNPENTCDDTNPNIDVLSNYGNLYLIGAYTPLTKLAGECTNENSDYVRHIKYGTELLPQTNSVSVIFNYGYMKEEVCREFKKE